MIRASGSSAFMSVKGYDHDVQPFAIGACAYVAGHRACAQLRNLMAEIDAALVADPQVDEATKNEVEQLRSIGEDQHTAGEHEAAEETLTDALTLLDKR